MKNYKPQVRTKNFSSAPLRAMLGEFLMRVIIRLGSRTTIEKAYPKKRLNAPVLEVNTVDSINNSRSKLLMKKCFADHNIPQSNWFNFNGTVDNVSTLKSFKNGEVVDIDNLQYPMVAKLIFGFKGHGMVKIDDSEQMLEFITNTHNLNSYYFEEYFNGSAEWRLHCTQNDCFMVWRKLRKADAENRWFFNSTNCVWIGEDNELFNKPNNWEEFIQSGIEAMKATGLDIGCVDIRSKSPNKDNPTFIVLETNSGPALGDEGLEKYKDKLTEVINNKINNYVQ